MLGNEKPSSKGGSDKSQEDNGVQAENATLEEEIAQLLEKENHESAMDVGGNNDEFPLLSLSMSPVRLIPQGCCRRLSRLRILRIYLMMC